MAQTEGSQFSFLRSIFWPVHRKEVKKVLSMFLLLFCLCVAYSVLRPLKDTVLLTAKHSGAEAIPFIKVWGMLPAVFIATWLYTRLRRWFSREAVFYVLVSSFVTYFLVYAFALYPHSEQLHLDGVGDWLTTHLPPGFKGLIALVRNWTVTSFYVISELWAVLVLTVLFWGFANDVSGVKEAKRTYGILNIGSNIAPMAAGGLGIFVANHLSLPFLSGISDQWERTLVQLLLFVALMGCVAMGLYYWINRGVLAPSEKQVEEAVPGEGKKKLSLRESLRYIASSRYLISLAVIVLGYNIAINLTDVLWKEQLKRFFVDPNQMLEHMNKITIGIGMLATFGALFFSFMITRLGWTFTAILTPAIMTVSAIGFFTFLFCSDALTAFSTALFGVTPFVMTVYCGSIQNCLSKASKYSVFDASKELAFLPLDAESKLKGKSAIDGLGSGVGKSGSSLVYQGFILCLGSVALSTPYISVILFLILSAWIFSVLVLGRRFHGMTTSENSSSVPA